MIYPVSRTVTQYIDPQELHRDIPTRFRFLKVWLRIDEKFVIQSKAGFEKF